MAMGVYIPNDVNNIFDDIRKLGIKEANQIIDELIDHYYNANLYSEKVTLTKDMNEYFLKRVLGNEYKFSQVEEFIKIFKNIQNESMSKNKKQLEMESMPMKFTNDLLMILDRIDDEIAWEMFDMENNPDIRNVLGIETLDASDDDFYFDVYYDNGKSGKVKIADFVRAYCSKLGKSEIVDFVKSYNKIKNKGSKREGNVIEVPKFNFNPKDVRATFISLVTETYPYGTEEEVVKYLPQNLEKDEFGNYYKIIGNSDTMFTSHLDTASRNKTQITLVSKIKDDQEMITSDGTTILGADDKAGVTVLLYMMAHNIPGVYYFFIGEERGGIGSSHVANNFYKTPHLNGIKKVVSFDRRNYYSVITSQYGMECCSDEFAESLCSELNKGGLKLNLDPTGVFTDSANFIEYVPECTNVSVGYFSEHTNDEVQNITYLEKLAKACLSVNWSGLKIRRKVGFDAYILEEYSDLISDMKALAFYNDLSIKGVEGKVVISLQFDDTSFDNAYEDLESIETILVDHKCNPNITFDGDIIKIKLG